jgi:peptidoglycan/xylan/chitin deacetylase (PgdA/CDA1 family)
LSACLLVLSSLVLSYTLSTSKWPEPPPTQARAGAALQKHARSEASHQKDNPAHTQRLKHPLWRGNPHLPEIALTFDDGPSLSFTPQILTILQRFGIKATFFCIGRQVANYPDLALQESADGDLVEDHSWSHPNLSWLSAQGISQQLSQSAQAIEQTTGTRPTFFRPPYGAFTPLVLTQTARFNFSTILWSTDPRDWSQPGTNAIVSRVLNTTSNGSIILLHDGGGNRFQTVAALPTLIPRLEARGFRFVTIQQLINDLA